MKKYFGFVVVFALLIAGAFGADKNLLLIDNFLDSYEDYVEAYEEAKESDNFSDMMKLSKQSLEMAERCDEMQSVDGWTLNDSKRMLELETRLSKAMEDDSSNYGFKSDDFNFGGFDAYDFDDDDFKSDDSDFDSDSYSDDLDDFHFHFSF